MPDKVVFLKQLFEKLCHYLIRRIRCIKPLELQSFVPLDQLGDRLESIFGSLNEDFRIASEEKRIDVIRFELFERTT